MSMRRLPPTSCSTYPSRRPITSGTPDCVQNRVLPGFQNRSALVSSSFLDVNPKSSPVTATSSLIRSTKTLPSRTITCQVVNVSGKLTQPRLLIANPINCYFPGRRQLARQGRQPMAQTEPRTANTAVPEDFDISAQGDVAKLKKGAIGLGGVLFLTVTGSAPITAMLLNTPIVV